MKITNQELRQIIKEELEAVLLERTYVARNNSLDELLKQLKSEIEDQPDEIDNVLVGQLFKQLDTQAGLDEQGRGFYIDFKNDAKAEIATKALFLLRKSDDDFLKKYASQWKGDGRNRMLFAGSRENLKNNLKNLQWNLRLPKESPYEKNMKIG